MVVAASLDCGPSDDAAVESEGGTAVEDSFGDTSRLRAEWTVDVASLELDDGAAVEDSFRETSRLAAEWTVDVDSLEFKEGATVVASSTSRLP